MSPSSSDYDFVLTRTQRLLSLLVEWWLVVIIGAFICFAIYQNAHSHPIFSAVLVLLLLFTCRGFFIGILNIYSDGKTHVEIQEKGVGFGRDTAAWWIFTDGIKEIRKNRWGTTTVRHHNGTYVDIPTSILTQEDMLILTDGQKAYCAFHKLPLPKQKNG